VRAVLYSLLGVLVGGAMVAGGIWGVVDSATDGDSGSSASADVAKTSSPEECSTVAKRDPRFKLPRDLTFGPYGRATVQCRGNAVAFTLDIDESALEPSTFYEVVLEKGKREEAIGSMLTAPPGGSTSPTTVTAGAEVPLRRYDFLTVRKDEFFAKGTPLGEPISAPIL
jgi:hypothetical protein